MNIFVRKFLVSLIVTLSVAFVLNFFNFFEFNYRHDLVTSFYGWLLIFLLYIGVAVILYGNIVSLFLEYLFNKFSISSGISYVLLHAFFGLANGIVFNAKEAALYGFVIAFFYALVDLWIKERVKKQKRVYPFFVLIFIFYLLPVVFLPFLSEEKQRLTLSEAVYKVAHFDDSYLSLFPNKIGTTQKEIDGYSVIYKTSAHVLDFYDNIYAVTFTLIWKKEEVVKGSWNITYWVSDNWVEVDAMDSGIENIPPLFLETKSRY